MKRLLIILIVIAVFALTGYIGKKGPRGNEQVVAFFGISDSALATALCPKYSYVGPADSACTFGSTTYYVPRDFTITRIVASVHNLTWAGTEACDVDVLVDAASIHEFFLGASGLRAAGDTDTVFGSALADPTDQAVTAGQVIEVKHTDPTVTTYCVAGAACACTAASASYSVTIYGVVQ